MLTQQRDENAEEAQESPVQRRREVAEQRRATIAKWKRTTPIHRVARRNRAAGLLIDTRCPVLRSKAVRRQERAGLRIPAGQSWERGNDGCLICDKHLMQDGPQEGSAAGMRLACWTSIHVV